MDARDKKSKKRSATSSSKPLDEIVFFIDRSLGRKAVATALRNVGAQVEVHDDHLPQDAKDEEWLRFVGARNWVVLTQDDRIRFHYHERIALLQAKVCAFVLTAKGLRGEENSAIIVSALPAIRRMLSKHPGPFIAKITRASDVTLFELPEHKKRSRTKSTR
jgi:predicted nuclease of predicted toxin-antitoxin system